MDALDKVLIIDDDPIHNMVSSKLILKANFASKTDKVLSGKLALEYLSRSNNEGNLPDLIFLDINMPLMDGWEFLQKFKELKPILNNEVHIFMLTSSISPQDYQKADESDEIRGFITKPLSIEKLNDIKSQIYA